MADRITFLAASISFYAVLSIFPLLLLVLVAGSLVGGEAFARAIVNVAEGLFTPETLEVLEEGLVSDVGRSGAGIASVVVLGWSGLKVFRGLDIAFSTVYGVGHEPSFLSTIMHAVTVLASLGAGIAAIILIQAAAAMLPISPVFGQLTPVLAFLALVILFFPMYFVFPEVDQSPPAVLPGTVVAAIGWTLLGELFGLYAANAGTYALFGLLGAFLLLLMWFYFGAIVLLVGAIVNAVLAGRYEEEPIAALPLVEKPIGPGSNAPGERDE